MDTKEKMMKMGLVFLGVLTLLVIAMIFSEVRAYRFIGSDNSRVATITVSGSAKKSVPPDIANISFGVTAEAKEVQVAQDNAAKKNNAVIEFLAKAGVDKKDIKSNVSLYPRYGNSVAINCPEILANIRSQGIEIIDANPCSNQVIIGYTANYQLEVKVREIAKAGELVAGVSKLGVTSLNGPYFTVEDEEVAKEEVRAEAIANAEAKADRLARDLGVKIVRMIDYSEAGGPIYYGKTMMAEAYGMGGDASVVPEILPGENEVVSNISITYEIR